MLLEGQIIAQSANTNANSTNVVSVTGSGSELGHGYLAWTINHPGAQQESVRVVKAVPLSGQRTTTISSILWPRMDIYSAAGVSIYYGSNSAQNVNIIDALPHELPTINTTSGRPTRPTLKEACSMFHALRCGGKHDSPQFDYTVFVINKTRAGFHDCEEQDAAIQRLKQRVEGTRIRIVEVRID